MTDDAESDPGKAIDPFPKPMGETLIPLDQEFHGTFRYSEFDSTGGVVLRQDLALHVSPKSKAEGLYGYAFERTDRGILLAFRDFGGNRDSAGIYIMGTFRDIFLTLDSTPVLWLPQFPKAGAAWDIGAGRKTELVDADTSFWTDRLFLPVNDTAAQVSHGFQKQPTVLFKETKDDTVTFYHFRRGVGCVGFERSARGKLIASGTLYQFFRNSRLADNLGF
jgi:hypothetical protein